MALPRARERGNMEVKFHIVHGGQLVLKDGAMVYEGGTVDESKWFNIDCLSRLEILWVVWGLGYSFCGPIYYKSAGGRFCELSTDQEMVNYACYYKGIGIATIYVDAPFDELALWNRVEKSELRAHLKRGTVCEVDKMVLNRRPKEVDAFTAFVDQVNLVDPVKYGSKEEHSIGEDGGSIEGEDGSGEEEDGGSIEFEASDDEGEETDGSDEDAEFAAVLKSRKEERKEQERRRKEVEKASSVKFGPVGVDRGLESYFRSEKDYSGKLAGDEGYIDSSDVDSFESESDSEDEDRDTPIRRKTSNKVHFDPECQIPLFELGMIFKSVYEFREAVRQYSVKRRVETEYQHNDNV